VEGQDPALTGEQLTRLLQDWANGEQTARDRLMPMVYDTLHRLAQRYLRDERHARTLQPTALVHEAYMRLVQHQTPDWQSRNHFYGIAAQLMRQILVDHARRRKSLKRGGGEVMLQLDNAMGVAAPGKSADVIALNDALEKLAELDPRRAKIVELRYFGGLTEEETASTMDLSVATVRRQMRLAEAWLHTQLISGDGA
jgi:RNA polymerase sigma factor (TIGR02999 family)